MPDYLEIKEKEQDFQSIIDAVVARHSASSSSEESGGTPDMAAVEELTFRETDKDVSGADLLVSVNDDTPDASISTDFADAADTVHIADVSGTADIEDIAIADCDADAEDVAAAEDYAGYITIADTAAEDATDTDDAASAEDIEIADTAAGNATDVDSAARAGNVAPIKYTPYLANACNPEGRLIFLSRTLSGLVDLFLTTLFAGIFLCTADYFTNSPMLNSMNAINFTALFLMIYFLYSIFFIGTNGQTVGMIMTDLRVVSVNEKPLLMSQVVRRNAAFLVSLFGLGIGLLAGVLNREYQCLHDRLSKTRVIRNC